MKKSAQRSTFPLLESIGAWHGKMPFLSYHQQRLERTFQSLYPQHTAHKLDHILQGVDIPDQKVKIRFLYNATEYKVELQPYERAKIQTLRIVEAPDIEYEFKYTDRKEIQRVFQKRGTADEILILKNGLLTDASYFNVVCITDQGMLTPATPLLQGIMRDYLLEKGKISEADIDEEMLREAKGVFLINALNPLATAPFISRRYIYF